MLKKMCLAIAPFLLVTTISLFVFAEDPGEDFVDTDFTGSEPSSVMSSTDTSTAESLIGELESTPTSTESTTDNSFEGTLESELTSEKNNFQAEDTSFQPTENRASESGNDLIVEQKTDYTLPYKERRGRHGVLFSVIYEQFYPFDYYSLYNDVYIEDIIGEDRLPLAGVELGYKFNFALGSLAALASYARGYTEKTVTVDTRSLDISRTNLAINFALDNFLKEPWIVPYGQVGMHQFSIIEDNLSQPDSESHVTSWSMNYKVGVLFQLNWIEKSIDPNTHSDGLMSSGLQNTFIDIYMAEHLSSSQLRDPADPLSEGDPDMASSQEIGVGLKMEF